VPTIEKSRKVLLITNDLGPRAGGIESFILGLLAQLPGGEIVIFTSSQEGSGPFDGDIESRWGVKVIRDRSKVLLPTPRTMSRARKIIHEFGVEIVWFGAAAPLAWMTPALKRAGVHRVVAITHGHEVWWSKIFPFSLAMRRIGRSVDVITYLGDFTKNSMRPALGENPELVRIAPGIDTKLFHPMKKDRELLQKYDLANKKVIVCVGRLVHRKGQDRLIQALPKIHQSHPEATILFVGQGPYRKKLDQIAQSLSLTDSIRFVGRVANEDLPRYFALGDVFAMPSRTRLAGLEVEGLGIVYLEAGSCGLPVIAGNSGGAPDAVREGETGLVVDGNDPDAISHAVIRILDDPPWARNLGLAGRAWAEKNWSWDLWGEKFAKVLFNDR
jgi:phosphatidyl-myo-inositol dimannoside synthase